jgi:hypothetical protein
MPAELLPTALLILTGVTSLRLPFHGTLGVALKKEEKAERRDGALVMPAYSAAAPARRRAWAGRRGSGCDGLGLKNLSGTVTGRDVKKSMDLCFFYCFHE